MFVYLGMAVFTFPIFSSTTWMLIVVSLLACFVGRLHIYVGSWLTNCFRSETTAMPPINSTYMFVMWFSGLRGGVAFALASVSFANMDFGDDCGGLAAAERAASAYCGHSGMSDSLAILQTTLIIATFTIFVFGGAITELCVAGGVLNPKGYVHPEDPPVNTGVTKTMRDFLTFGDHLKEDIADLYSDQPRYGAAVEHGIAGPPAIAPASSSASAAGSSSGMTTAEIKAKLASMEGDAGIEMTKRASSDML